MALQQKYLKPKCRLLLKQSITFTLNPIKLACVMN
jgi:hypothetical protein